MPTSKKILFLTGTRADFGKLKPLIRAVEECSPELESYLFVTGMHMLSKYGLTVGEVQMAGFRNIHTFINQHDAEPMDLVLSNTIAGLSRYVQEYEPDLIVVHGDRIEAMAGAIVGALRNIPVAHIEGGELSGTVDELLRHSVSKLSHIHFVANSEAADRLRQLGESPDSIYVIGSPDIDVMLSADLPTLARLKERYELPFTDYGVAIFHPVTTELARVRGQAGDFVAALVESGRNFAVIYPNNDVGSDHIFEAYEALTGNPRFRVYPSLRFEYFLSLLRHADFVVGNSSAGVREAPVYAVPCINVGTRQLRRFRDRRYVADVPVERAAILAAIGGVAAMRPLEPCLHFGQGESAAGFKAALLGARLWQTPRQKQFHDYLPPEQAK